MADESKPVIYFEDPQLDALLTDDKLVGVLGDNIGNVLVGFMNCVMEEVPYDEFIEIAVEHFEGWELTDVADLAKHVADKLVLDPSIQYEFRED